MMTRMGRHEEWAIDNINDNEQFMYQSYLLAASLPITGGIKNQRRNWILVACNALACHTSWLDFGPTRRARSSRTRRTQAVPVHGARMIMVPDNPSPESCTW